MPHRISACVRLFMVLSLCAALGLQWAALQSIAWAGMLVSYSRSAGLAEAVAKTFDGRHPCALCRAVGKASGSRKSEAQSATGKFDMECRAAAQMLPPPWRRIGWRRHALLAGGFQPEPSVPPPRAA